jgi:hypothetical protein
VQIPSRRAQYGADASADSAQAEFACPRFMLALYMRLIRIRVRMANRMFRHVCRLSLLIAALALFDGAAAADTAAYSIAIKDRKFQPADIEIPANQKIELQVRNLDATPAEFESSDLRREKVVPGGDSVIVYIGPLDPGRYEFFNDFNPAARGHIVAK